MTEGRFKKIIWEYYVKNRRDFPWRIFTGSAKNSAALDITPYQIVVSEIMLQQTQAHRVLAKFESFIKKFPDFKALAEASLEDVLKEWQGLGYNRRGLNLKKLAEIIYRDYRDQVPQDPHQLLALPGIGPGTVGSILAFVHNLPHPFIETNIRTVFIHFFFKNTENIRDEQILQLVKKTLDEKNPREWYYALMDYGVMLKKLYKNPSRKSAHYNKQTSFKGSNRELRSHILAFILNNPGSTLQKITANIEHALVKENNEAIKKNIDDLKKEGFLSTSGNKLYCCPFIKNV